MPELNKKIIIKFLFKKINKFYKIENKNLDEVLLFFCIDCIYLYNFIEYFLEPKDSNSKISIHQAKFYRYYLRD